MAAQGNQRGKSRVTSQRWKRVDLLFEQALEIPAAERPQFVRTIDDDELRGEVESLLKAHDQAGTFLDQRDNFFSSESFEADAFSPGQIIDRYRIIREIGRGGMGAVFRAERADDEYRKQVALKLIKRGTDTDSVLRHFRNERQILAGFDHPNIARLFDGGTTERGLPYFVMEYIEGLPMDEFCNSHDLSVSERLKLFREVCSAVSYAHRHLVIHRDIKRSNILITAQGVPKLLDFGIAKILQQDDEPLVTLTGMRLMTPQYASPEQLRGEPMTTASDVYSLGVVLYELLTGQLPYRFASQSPHDVARVIAEQEPTRPSTAVKDRDSRIKSADSSDAQLTLHPARLLRGDLDNIVLLALRKEPERRYQSVEQFSEDIRRHLEERPVLARKDTVGYRAAKFVRRNKLPLAAAAIVLIALVGGIIATSAEARIAKREKARAERRFNDVRKLAHSVLFDYHDAIKDLPGATKVRERLVKDGLNYLDSLAAEAHGDPALQRELAAAYDRVGDVRGQAYTANLGDRVGATDSYMKALRIREALVAANPRDTQTRGDLAEDYRRIGWQLRDTSDASRGVEHLQKAIAIYSELTTEQPENTELRDKLAYSYNQLGLFFWDRLDWRSALDQHYRARALREKLVADNPGEPRYRRGLSATYANIGLTLLSSGDAAGALEIGQKALELKEALAASDPTNVDYRRNVAIGYGDDGEYRSALNDMPGALESYRKSVAIYEELMAVDPTNAQLYQDVGYPYRRVGELLTSFGQDSQALEVYRKALRVYEKGSAETPENVPMRLSLAICQANIGELEARSGKSVSALDQCRKAVSALQVTTEEPTNAYHRDLKAQAYRSLGDAYAALAISKDTPASERIQHWNAAREMFQQSLSILEDMRSRGNLAPSNARQPEEVTQEIAKCETALGK